MIIIESKINDTVLMLKKSEKAKGKTESLELPHQVSKSTDYKKKKEKSKNDKLDNLW
jgi:hypothetical protein